MSNTVRVHKCTNCETIYTCPPDVNERIALGIVCLPCNDGTKAYEGVHYCSTCESKGWGNI